MDATTETMIRTCCTPGCATLTLGHFCMEHEVTPIAVMPRGRPFVAAALELGPNPLAGGEPVVLASTTPS